jgi:hypothetical protein
VEHVACVEEMSDTKIWLENLCGRPKPDIRETECEDVDN